MGKNKIPICYVAADGRPDNKGREDSPWDIASALSGEKKIEPGTAIYLRGGIYRRRTGKRWGGIFQLSLNGSQDRPIHLRPYPGERVTIDGGLEIRNASYVWVWDLEIMVSEPNPAEPTEPGSYTVFVKPDGGLHIRKSDHCKYINLVVHHTTQGFGFWKESTNSEIYGCLIYDNGWLGKDRGHGHAIYTQNKKGTKTISDCIMTGGYGYSMHAYGQDKLFLENFHAKGYLNYKAMPFLIGRAYLDNFHIEGNIAYDAGPFLVGGMRPSRNCKASDNYLYNVAHLQFGYGADKSQNCQIRKNIIVNGDLNIKGYSSGAGVDNLIVNGRLQLDRSQGLTLEKNRVISKEKMDNLAVLRVNKYDPCRANLAIYNFRKDIAVQLDASGFLENGEGCILKDPKRFFDEPVYSVVCEKGKISLPLGQKEFAAFVMLKKQENLSGL